MSAKKFHSAFWNWLKIALTAFLLMLAVIFVLPPIFTILRVPPFVIGNDIGWLLRWARKPRVRFAGSFNPVTLMAHFLRKRFTNAAVIGLVGVWIGTNRQRRNLRRDRR